ncbi:autoinducer binding domain-containing protein [Pseudomonas sp. BBP2017]|uniref:autoinducer binding domain-containing protein n=1 Tax=Pseudomonas sp. BBP2017 TaxID=2109731 RepID=UPI0013047D37|nr:autoinducer binding domain-containing protein [Pseudomonas sp. BBP2017]
MVDLPHLLDSLPLLIEELGFHFYAFAFISPTRCEKPTPYPCPPSNYPDHWFKHYNLHSYAAFDPVPIHCQTSSFPLPWNAATFNNTPEIWTEARAHGLNHGWVQPIHHEQARSHLSVIRPHVSVTPQEFYQKAAQVMWLGELLHRASSDYFADHKDDHRPGAPA